MKNTVFTTTAVHYGSFGHERREVELYESSMLSLMIYKLGKALK
jgi:hypothetical protein